MGKKNKKFNIVKTIKRLSREEEKQYGKAGPHCNKRERRANKKNTFDYLLEAIEDGYVD